MLYNWQFLLFSVFKEGIGWLNKLPPTDWRRQLIGQHGLLPSLNVQLVMSDYQAQHLLRQATAAAPAAQTKRAFILEPCKYDQESLTVLTPIIGDVVDEPSLSLQLGILRYPHEPGSFFGYRFESPEVHENHRFHHVQPLQSFCNEPRLPISIAGYPHRYPSVPLASTNATELIGAMLIAIRDWPQMTEFVSGGVTRHQVKVALGAMMERITREPGAM
jgi:hypothetical protein